VIGQSETRDVIGGSFVGAARCHIQCYIMSQITTDAVHNSKSIFKLFYSTF